MYETTEPAPECPQPYVNDYPLFSTKDRSTTTSRFAAAYVAAWAELSNATKVKDNPHFKSRYADLAEVLDTIRETLPRHKLALLQFPGEVQVLGEELVVSVRTVLLHESGEYLAGTVSAPLAKSDPQGVGSAITYLRRYGAAAICGIAQEDDDGNAASGKKGPKVKAPDARSPKGDKTKLAAAIAAAASSEQLARLRAELVRLPIDEQKELSPAYKARQAELAEEGR